MALYIISQTLVIMGMVMDLIGKIMKQKKFILLFMILANIFYVTSYICLRSPFAAIANSVNFVRCVTYFMLDHKEKSIANYITPMIVFDLVCVIAVAFYWNGVQDLALLFAMLVGNTILISKNTLVIRVGLIFVGIGWFTYNFTLRAYGAMICDILNFIFVIVALIYYNFYLEHKKKTIAMNDQPKQEAPK